MESPQEYGITRQRVFVLRIDAMHHFVMIPYRRQTADYIHALRHDFLSGIRSPDHYRVVSYREALLALLTRVRGTSLRKNNT